MQVQVICVFFLSPARQLFTSFSQAPKGHDTSGECNRSLFFPLDGSRIVWVRHYSCFSGDEVNRILKYKYTLKCLKGWKIDEGVENRRASHYYMHFCKTLISFLAQKRISSFEKPPWYFSYCLTFLVCLSFE